MESAAPLTDGRTLADPDTCRQLRAYCSSARTRTVGVPPKHRSRWQPSTVRDPRTGEYFDTVSAFAFIEDCLDAGAEVEVIIMDQPPGKKGFVMLIEGHGADRIYIKLELGHRGVIGRSFHASDEKSRRK